MNLTPGTLYTITVAAVNGAGLGLTSDSIVGMTEAAPPPPPDPVPVELPTQLVPTNVRTQTIIIPTFSEVNAPISHYQVFVVLLPTLLEVSSLDPPEQQFPNINVLTDVYQPSLCNGKPTSPQVYVTAEFAADDFPSNNLFIVGQVISTDQSPNDRPNTYTNGELCYPGKYTFFVRAYIDTSINQRSKRQTQRQYDEFQTSGYNPTVYIGLLSTPTLLSVNSVTSRSVIVSWQIDTSTIPITGYMVRVVTSTTGQVVFSDENLPPTALMLTLRDLQPTTDYQFFISAVNTAGTGEQTSVTFTTIKDAAFFQLRLLLTGVGQSCNDWIAIDRTTLSETIDEVANSIVTNVEGRCQCGFSRSNITSDGFRCFPGSTDAVTYRGEIHETDTVSVFDLIHHIEEWTSEGVSILVQRVFIEIDSSCSVAIESFNEEECLPPSTQAASVIGGAVAAVVVVLIVIAGIVIITIVILVMKKRKALFKLENSFRFGAAYDDVNVTAIQRVREEGLPGAAEYETMEMVSHDYETLNTYSKEYETIDTPNTRRQLTGGYDITTCEAYGTSTRVQNGSSDHEPTEEEESGN